MIAGAQERNTDDIVTLMSLLQLADRKTDEKKATALVQKKPNLINQSFTTYNMTPLLMAIYRKHPIVNAELFAILLAGTNNLNHQDSEGKALLHYLAYYAKPTSRRFGYLKQALEKKALLNLNIRTLHQETPVFMATYARNAEALMLLIKAGADVTLANDEDQTPLHVACLHGDERCVLLLMAAGAKVNARDKKGFTPLQYLAQCKGVKSAILQRMLQDLLEHGADAGLKSKRHHLPEQGAKQYGNLTLAAVLQENRVPPLFQLCSRIVCKNIHVYTKQVQNPTFLPADVREKLEKQLKCK